MEQTARSEVGVDDARVRVTTWTFQPGERTGRHRHELPYVVVPLTHGRMLVEAGGAQTVNPLTPGGCYAREAGAEHDVSNGGTEEMAFVEIELK